MSASGSAGCRPTGGSCRSLPIADYGFWGIRSGRDDTRALIARGNRGVRLELADGSFLLIGSQRSEALARAIEHAMRPGT